MTEGFGISVVVIVVAGMLFGTLCYVNTTGNTTDRYKACTVMATQVKTRAIDCGPPAQPAEKQ